MDKSKVVSAFAQATSQNIANLVASLEDTRKRTQDAPGSNTTHSDTSKFQLGNLALSIEVQVQKARETLAYISSIPVHCEQIVQVGSVFELMDTKTEGIKIFFLVGIGGGETFSVDGIMIITTTFSSPLGRVCIGKKNDQEVSCNGRTYIIKNVE
ncbi:MAG: hypothetical protein AAB501_02945 [Patescibacteria group bacterium]